MIKKIYIAWRKAKGESRFIVARLVQTRGAVHFEPLPGLDVAKSNGLISIPGFMDSGKTNEDVRPLLEYRVINKDRPDRVKFLSFWEAQDSSDLFEILGLTQGISPTDNFEFLAEFIPKKELIFVTDLAGLSHFKHSPGLIKQGDVLDYKMEKDNRYDPNAVAIYKGRTKIGYIKQIHNRLFHTRQAERYRLKLIVKEVDEAEMINQIFIRVSFE